MSDNFRRLFIKRILNEISTDVWWLYLKQYLINYVLKETRNSLVSLVTFIKEEMKIIISC